MFFGDLRKQKQEQAKAYAAPLLVRTIGSTSAIDGAINPCLVGFLGSGTYLSPSGSSRTSRAQTGSFPIPPNSRGLRPSGRTEGDPGLTDNPRGPGTPVSAGTS